MTVVQTQSNLKASAVIEAYESFVDMVGAELPKIDTSLIMEMLMHYYLFKEERPKMRLEILYTKNTNAKEKKDEMYESRGRAGEIRDNHMLIIDGHFTLKDVEDLAKDTQVHVVKGNIIP
ncbi:MAG: hypothetical protein ACE5KA_06995 [Nitrososphaerales archaeon]